MHTSNVTFTMAGGNTGTEKQHKLSGLMVDEKEPVNTQSQ